jgi:hypothetical protein
MFAPVIHFPRSDASSATTSATSSGDPRRPSGTDWANTSGGAPVASLNAFRASSPPGVITGPGDAARAPRHHDLRAGVEETLRNRRAHAARASADERTTADELLGEVELVGREISFDEERCVLRTAREPHEPSAVVRESIEIVRAAWRPGRGHSTLRLDGRSKRGSRLGSSAADPLGFHGRARTVGRGIVGREGLRPLPLHGARQCVAQCRRYGRARRRALRFLRWRETCLWAASSTNCAARGTSRRATESTPRPRRRPRFGNRCFRPDDHGGRVPHPSAAKLPPSVRRLERPHFHDAVRDCAGDP